MEILRRMMLLTGIMGEYSLLHFDTVTPILKDVLYKLMEIPVLADFRLVGGTNLSLKYGFRHSDDIDLFTDAVYDTVDFDAVVNVIKEKFPYCDHSATGNVGCGVFLFVGESADKCVKLDLMYTDPFLDEPQVVENIRMATTPDIAAMKMEAIATGGRKKDFWDIHFLLDSFFTLDQLLELHKKRNPYTHNRGDMLEKLVDYSDVDNEPDPISYLFRDWDEIKFDLIQEVEKLS